MRITSSNRLCSFLLVLLAPALLFAQSPKQIGTIITTQGAVFARDAAGASRVLTRRSEVFEGDTLIVAAGGFTSVRMKDNAHLSLGPDTEFAFKTYQSDGKPATRDRVVMSLVRGCFRTVIGKAGASKRDEYRIETPVANIAIDGSFHGATLIGERLYTATWEGSTTVSNAAGSIELGSYGDFDYSRTYPDAAPRGLMALQPEALCEPPESLDERLRENGIYVIDRDEKGG